MDRHHRHQRIRRMHEHRSPRHQQAKILTGAAIITFGVLFFLEKAGIGLPHWLLSWESFLIVGGLISLYRHRFQSFVGWVLLGLGTVFLTNEFYPNTFDSKFILPVIIILFGAMMIIKATNLFKKKDRHKTIVFDEDVDVTSDDFISATTFFGGTTKNVLTKDFQGADFSTTFGGAEINLTQADIQKPVTINSNTTFGGIKLVVPSNWQVNSEITTIFGGVEDKRQPMTDSERDPNKVITLKGSCFFGGVEIQSYI